MRHKLFVAKDSDIHARCRNTAWLPTGLGTPAADIAKPVKKHGKSRLSLLWGHQDSAHKRALCKQIYQAENSNSWIDITQNILWTLCIEQPILISSRKVLHSSTLKRGEQDLNLAVLGLACVGKLTSPGHSGFLFSAARSKVWMTKHFNVAMSLVSFSIIWPAPGMARSRLSDSQTQTIQSNQTMPVWFLIDLILTVYFDGKTRIL